MKSFNLMKNLRCFSLVSVLLTGLWAAPLLASQDQEVLARSLSHYIMGMNHDLGELTEEAIQEYKEALSLDPDNYAIHLHLGIDYARLGQLSDAVEELKLVHRFNREDLQSHYLPALIYSSQKDLNKAADEYELILKHFSKAEPENIEIYGYLGQLYYSQGKFEKAIEEFEKILSLQPQNADVLYLLGSLHLEKGSRQNAVDFFKKALTVNPDHGGSLNSLGYLYAEDGIHLDEALDLIKRALNSDPNNGAYLDSLGWIYYKKEMYTEALEALKKANSILEDPVVYDHMGDVYSKMNEIENARRCWRLSLELSPQQTSILKKINDSNTQQARKESLSSSAQSTK